MKAFYRLFLLHIHRADQYFVGVTIARVLFVSNAAPDSFKFMPFVGLVLPILLLANLASAIYYGRFVGGAGFSISECYIQQLGVYELCITIAFFSPASSPMVKMECIYSGGVDGCYPHNVMLLTTSIPATHAKKEMLLT